MHFSCTIRLQRYLCDELKAIIEPAIQRNAYFCHPKYLLLTMLSDDRKEIRQLETLEQGKLYGLDFEKFLLPKLNSDASDYNELIDWQLDARYRTTTNIGSIGRRHNAVYSNAC